MWLYNQRVIYICICLCSDNCFRTDQTRLGYYDVTARLTLMIDLLSLLFINDLKDWFVSANYILWFTVGCRWSLFEIWRIECKQKGSKLNCYLVPPYISVKFDWGLGVSVVCTALRSDSDPCCMGPKGNHSTKTKLQYVKDEVYDFPLSHQTWNITNHMQVGWSKVIQVLG